MKKIACLIAVLLAIVAVGHAQPSKVFVVSHDLYKEDVIGIDIGGQMMKDGDGFIQMVTEDAGSKYIAHSIGKIKFSIKLGLKDKDGRVVIENKLENGNKVFGPIRPVLLREGGDIYLVYFLMEGGDDPGNLKIFAAQVDPATLAISTPKELITIDQKKMGHFSVERYFKNHRLVLKASPDESRVALVWTSGIDNDISVGLFDDHLNRIWNKRVTLQYEDPVELSDVFADNAGKIVLSYKNSLGHDIYEGHLLILGEKTATVDKNIRVPEGFPWEIKLAPIPSSRMLSVIGTYTIDGEVIDGVFQSALNMDDLSMKAIKVMSVPDDALELFRKDTWAMNKKKERGLFPIKMLAFAAADGTVDLIGEFKRLQSGTVHINGFLLSGDVLWVHIAEGKAIFGRVPKIRVSTTNLIGSSFSVLSGTKGLFVFYNDTEANLRKDIQDEPSRSDHFNNVVLVAATLGPGGEVRRQKIADLAADHYVAVTELIQPNDPDGILVLFERINGLGSVVGEAKWTPVELK